MVSVGVKLNVRPLLLSLIFLSIIFLLFYAGFVIYKSQHPQWMLTEFFMYVILPLYGFSIPAEMENGPFLYREPKNLGVRKKGPAGNPAGHEKCSTISRPCCIYALRSPPGFF